MVCFFDVKQYAKNIHSLQIKSLDYENIIFDNAINGAKLITLNVDQLQVCVGGTNHRISQICIMHLVYMWEFFDCRDIMAVFSFNSHARQSLGIADATHARMLRECIAELVNGNSEMVWCFVFKIG